MRRDVRQVARDMLIALEVAPLSPLAVSLAARLSSILDSFDYTPPEILDGDRMPWERLTALFDGIENDDRFPLQVRIAGSILAGKGGAT